jgi:hypothetical protein
MHDAFGVSGVEGVGDFYGEGDKNFEVERASGDTVLEGDALEVFHGDEGPSFKLTDVMDGADMWVVQCGCGLGFTLEAAQGLRVFSDVVRKEFEGNETVQACVLGLVDYSHPAAAQLLDDAVVRDGLADH